MARPALPPDLPLVPDLADDTSVKVIGLGGVGAIVARYLAMFLASLDRDLRLVLIDGDAFEASNATRMYFSSYGNKAAVSRADLLDRFADSRLTVVAIEQFVTPENIDRLIHERDVVILAVDNHATRKLVSDFCASRRSDVCLISGGNDGVGTDSSGRRVRGTYGNCQVYIRHDGEDATPSLTRHHPEIARPADHLPTDKSCTELVASVPQLLFANLTVAASVLNTFFLYACGAVHYGELAFDIAEGLMRPTAVAAPRPSPRTLAAPLRSV